MKPVRTTGLHLDPIAQQRYNELQAKVLSNISYGTTMSNGDPSQNMDVWKATGVSPSVANTEFAVQHGLGRVPMGYHLVKTDKAAHVYAGVTAWTKTTVYLKFDTASVNYSLVIL